MRLTLLVLWLCLRDSWTTASIQRPLGRRFIKTLLGWPTLHKSSRFLPFSSWPCPLLLSALVPGSWLVPADVETTRDFHSLHLQLLCVQSFVLSVHRLLPQTLMLAVLKISDLQSRYLMLLWKRTSHEEIWVFKLKDLEGNLNGDFSGEKDTLWQRCIHREMDE